MHKDDFNFLSSWMIISVRLKSGIQFGSKVIYLPYIAYISSALINNTLNELRFNLENYF